MKILLFNSQKVSFLLFIFLIGIISCQEIPDASQFSGNKTSTQLHFKQTFNKCGTINDPFTDRGFGQRTYLGVDYGIERFGKFQFYLVPQIQVL